MTVNKQELKLHVYKITKWGIYGTEKNQTEPKCSGIKDTLDDLFSWGILDQKPLQESVTYDASGDLLCAYLWGMHKDGTTGDWLISLWNEVENKDGKVLYAQSTQAVGAAKATSVNLGKDMIPGFPSIFWVLPKLERIVCIVPSWRRQTGTRQFESYIKSFIECFSPYVVRDKHNPRVRVGLSTTPKPKKDDERIPDSKLHAVLYVHPQRRPGHFEKLLDSADKIRKIIKKVDVQSITGRPQYERGIYHLVRHALKLRHENIPATSRKTFRLEFPVQLTRDDVQRAIDEFQAGHDNDLLDVGYKIDGEATPLFLSGSRVVEDVSINFHEKPDGTPDLPKLMKELSGLRDDVKGWIV